MTRTTKKTGTGATQFLLRLIFLSAVVSQFTPVHGAELLFQIDAIGECARCSRYSAQFYSDQIVQFSNYAESLPTPEKRCREKSITANQLEELRSVIKEVDLLNWTSLPVNELGGLLSMDVPYFRFLVSDTVRLREIIVGDQEEKNLRKLVTKAIELDNELRDGGGHVCSHK